jgi:hypothetical protein
LLPHDVAGVAGPIDAVLLAIDCQGVQTFDTFPPRFGRQLRGKRGQRVR